MSAIKGVDFTSQPRIVCCGVLKSCVFGHRFHGIPVEERLILKEECLFLTTELVR